MISAREQIAKSHRGKESWKNKGFSTRRSKERKRRQEIRTCLLLLSVLCVFAVKILYFEGF
jgi:hypothetical protein